MFSLSLAPILSAVFHFDYEHILSQLLRSLPNIDIPELIKTRTRHGHATLNSEVFKVDGYQI